MSICLGLLCQTQSLSSPESENDKELSELYSGVGSSVVPNGFGVGLDGTFIVNNNFGGSIGMKRYLKTPPNVPEDYSSGFLGFPPYDKFGVFSFMLAIKKPLPERNLRFGVDLGPSVIVYKEIKFSENPDYESSCFLICPPKYLTDHEKHAPAVGLTARAKFEIVFSRSIGIEINAFTNVSAPQSLSGIEVNMMLGWVNSSFIPRSQRR
jgi:hypothetical protein